MSHYYGLNQYQNDAPETYFSAQDLINLLPTLMNNMPQGLSFHQSGSVSPQHLMSLPPMLTLMNNMPQGPSSHQSNSVSPHQLLSLPPALTLISNMPQGASSHQCSKRRKCIEEFGCLAPGAKHQLSQDPLPTPQSILDGSYLAALQIKEIVLYVPRLPQYSHNPSLPTIVFSVNGVPGPYLGDLLKQRVTLDKGGEMIFRDHYWKRTEIIVDWPGVASSGEFLSCFNDKKRPITRTEMARIVANSVASVVSTGKSGRALKWGPQVINSKTRPWDLRKIDYRDVRLIAINYYRKLWVPVLAIDVD